MALWGGHARRREQEVRGPGGGKEQGPVQDSPVTYVEGNAERHQAQGMPTRGSPGWYGREQGDFSQRWSRDQAPAVPAAAHTCGPQTGAGLGLFSPEKL